MTYPGRYHDGQTKRDLDEIQGPQGRFTVADSAYRQGDGTIILNRPAGGRKPPVENDIEQWKWHPKASSGVGFWELLNNPEGPGKNDFMAGWGAGRCGAGPAAVDTAWGGGPFVGKARNTWLAGYSYGDTAKNSSPGVSPDNAWLDWLDQPTCNCGHAPHGESGWMHWHRLTGSCASSNHEGCSGSYLAQLCECSCHDAVPGNPDELLIELQLLRELQF